MIIEEKNYIKRLIDKKISLYLKTFKAVLIVGPTGCGKTCTSMYHANSIINLIKKENRDLACLNPKFVINEDIPEVIDEWQLVPEIWDVVRNACDMRETRGNYILTSSFNLINDKEKDTIKHSGTGRIAKINMYPMSLYELGNSLDYISLMDMYEGKEINKLVKPMEIKELARFILNGGWLDNSKNKRNVKDGLFAKQYIKFMLSDEFNALFDREKMAMILKSLAKHDSSYTAETTILRDSFDFANIGDETLNRRTLRKYLQILDSLYLTNNQKPFLTKYGNSNRICKSVKRRFVDPSIATALLDLSSKKLVKDLNTFGLLFESLVVRDLNVYMEYYGGSVYAFRDNLSGDEVDAICEFDDGEYGAIEIKLGQNQMNDAISSLIKFKEKVEKKPKFLCVIVGIGAGVTRDINTGVYIVPINALGMHFEK